MIQTIDIMCIVYLAICFILFLVFALRRKAYRDDSKKYFEGEQKEHVLQEKIKIEKIKAKRGKEVEGGFVGATISVVIGMVFIVLIISMAGVLGGAVKDTVVSASVNQSSAMNDALASIGTITTFLPLIMMAVIAFAVLGGIFSFMGGGLR